MRGISKNKVHRPPFKRVTQITDSHCGPAVVQMLLSKLRVKGDQEAITRAASAVRFIRHHGMRIDQLALAIKKLYPKVQFWYKDHAKIDDIRRLLREYDLPVAVEWQGLFGDIHRSKKYVVDGHYSIIVQVEDQERMMTMVDPYKDFEKNNRRISINRFVRRWWDINDYINPKTKKVKEIRDNRMLFVITKKDFEFPRELGMRKGD